MIFAYSYQALWFFIFFLLLFVAIRNLKNQKSLLTRLIEFNLIERLFPFKEWRLLNFRITLLKFTGILFLILSLMGPRIGQRLQEIKTKGSNIFILFDCSDSMLAEDFKPNRMEKSKRLLTGLLEKLSGNRLGIIAFSGEPYVYCPLTFDSSSVKQFLKTIEPGIIPQPGTAIGSAIRLALGKMPEAGAAKAIVLLTDGEDHNSDPAGAAEECKQKNVRLYSIGIGSPEGEPIPLRDANAQVSGYKKNSKGEVVMSKLDEQTLAQISMATGGSYFRASDTEQEIDLLASQLSALEKEPVARRENLYENRYQWFLFIAILLLALGELLPYISRRFRKTSALLALLFFAILLPQNGRPLYADSFRKKMKEGNKLYGQEKYPEALESYEQAGRKNPSDMRANFNTGDAAYRLREWDKAAEEFEKGSFSKDSKIAARSFYNLGNTQFRKGQYGEASKSYQQSIRLNHYDEDAKFNLKMALQFLKNPPKPRQKKQQDKQKEEKKNGGKKDKQAEERKKEQAENAKRMLKSAGENQNDKPVFKRDDKKGKKKYEEDW